MIIFVLIAIKSLPHGCSCDSFVFTFFVNEESVLRLRADNEDGIAGVARLYRLSKYHSRVANGLRKVTHRARHFSEPDAEVLSNRVQFFDFSDGQSILIQVG